MAVPLPIPQPTLVPPMRAALLRSYDPLNRWLASLPMQATPDRFPPLADNQAYCQVYMSFHEGMRGPTYRLTFTAYHPSFEQTNAIELARFVGFPSDNDVLLWARRLPPNEYLCFGQPLDFAARLVGGMTDIPVKSLTVSFIRRHSVRFFSSSLAMQSLPGDEQRMVHWARDALVVRDCVFDLISHIVLTFILSVERGSFPLQTYSASSCRDGKGLGAGEKFETPVDLLQFLGI